MVEHKTQKTLHYPVVVDSEIKLYNHPALGRLHQALTKRLSFPNPAWKKKHTHGLSTHNTPKILQAFTRGPEGALFVARGAWKTVRDIANQHNVTLQWEARTRTPEDCPAQFAFDTPLRPYQQHAINAIRKSRSGVIVIPTGGGKTMVAMALAATLQTRTLFIVHTRELLRQTQQSVERFLHTQPGVAGGGKWAPKDFTIALVQTLCKRDLEGFADQFGLVIVDEAHHAPAQSYRELLRSFPARYRVALTATPFRKDGLHNLLWMQFGDILYQVPKHALERHGRLMRPTFHPILTEFRYSFHNDFSALISALCRDPERHRHVIRTITQTHRPRGCSLILTERVDHAKQLFRSLQAQRMPVVLLHGKCSNA
ncbi:MAG: DEAD/DEAH box helicase, partial [Myxococcota bacterium]